VYSAHPVVAVAEQLVELFEIERLGLDRTDANTQDDDQQ
jgi:hypothetical protein